MLKRLKSLLKENDGKNDEKRRHDLSLAVTAVMVEVMRIDGNLDAAEHDIIVRAVERRFDLPADKVRALIEEATRETDNSHDLHQFTSQIIKAYDTEERIAIVRELWQVAMADGHVDPHEEHLIRRTAELIGVYHKEFIAAKLAARREE